MAKLLDPNFASQPCDRFDWWLVESNTDISGLFSTRKQKKNFFIYLKNKKELQKKRLSQGPQIPMSLMRIDGHSDIHKYQINNKIKATKVKQNWRSSHEIKLKKKNCDRLQGHNDRGSHVGSKCWSSRSNKLIRWAISISIFNNIVVC